jgi:HEAT repeat protein
VDSLDDLARDLDDADVAVRLRALARGVAARTPGFVKAVRARAPLQQDPVVRTAFVTALVRLGEDALLKEVARALRHRDAVVVTGAARVLGAIGDARAVPNLIEAFKTEDVVVGAAVARALGQLGDVVVVPWLIAALEQGFCVEACAQALGALGDARATAALRALASSSSEPRLKLAASQALHALQERGDG